jgi:hypothetical protein
MYMQKMIPVETFPGMGWGGIKDRKAVEGGEFKYDIIDIL